MGRIYDDAEQLERVYTEMFDAVADDDSMDTQPSNWDLPWIGSAIRH